MFVYLSCQQNQLTDTEMTTKSALFSALVILITNFNVLACPVNPVPVDTMPFPDEAREAIISRNATALSGMAIIKFHVDVTGHVVVEAVQSESSDLTNHVWETVHGMETADTTLAQGESYNFKLIVK